MGVENQKKEEDQTKSKGWLWWLIVLVLASMVFAAAVLTLLKNFKHSNPSGPGVPDHPGPIVAEYANALGMAMQFFDIQKSGKLVDDRVWWRGDSGLQDGIGSDGMDLDLSKGMYDAGDLVKFGFPMAFTATILSWAILEYGDQMNSVNQLGYAQDSLNVSFPQVQEFYNSTGYGDELLWAAAWLYHATRDESYLSYVTEINGQAFANWGSLSWFSWDDKHAGTQVLLSRINFFGGKEMTVTENVDIQMYRKTAEIIMCGLLPDSPTSTSSRTQNGLIWVIEWHSLQHSMASAFLAVLYSDYMLTSQTEMLYCDGKSFKPEDLRKFAMSQVDYVLGKNPMEMSYVVGYGSNFPQYVHHRGSSIPVDAETGCKDGFKWLYSPKPNPNEAIGALVGGPFFNDTYNDVRNNSMQTEPSTYNNALFVALLSGLVTTSSVVQSFS
ncbi:hypothetical protein F8388_009256 [Cannabis sativa]|uniref:Endoglucanase n=1 Tax=Cannabis sativa TaxID=3483 RepID=A0A7J6FMD9_CANSA|nr:hypothetical protein G4B88_016917 [Cannabis sativa]KAF4383225.1 hypothetical protein F8388_009256 [Cannabis sativa]